MADVSIVTIRDAFLMRIQEEKESIQLHLSEGNIENYAEYNNFVGVIQGLNIAERELKDVFNIIEKS